MLSNTAASASAGGFSDEEQSQLRIMIKKFTINYKPATGKEIVFSPSMLELGETEYALGIGASTSSRLKQSVREERSVIYLPDTHKIKPIFMKYYKQYSPTIGNPALVFIDKVAFLDYMKYATKLISDEQKKNSSVTPGPGPPPAPGSGTVKLSSFVDSDNVKQLNDNIKFVIETIFSKNRVLTVGGDFKVQVNVGGRKVLLNQEYYIESLPTIADKSTPAATVPIYVSADSKVFDLEEKADEKKREIADKEKLRKEEEVKLEAAQKELNDAKNNFNEELKLAAAATPPTILDREPFETIITKANNVVLDVRKAYKTARENEKIAISERAAILNKINQFKYGRENSKITDILTKVSTLKREMVTKEIEITKIKSDIEKIEVDIGKKKTDIDTTQNKIHEELENAANIYDISTGGGKTSDTLLAEITSAYNSNANRINNIQAKPSSSSTGELDKKLLQNSQYDIIAKMIKKLKDRLKDDKLLIDIGSSNGLLTKKKGLETNRTTLEVDYGKRKREIEKLNLSLYDYTLRLYMFDMPALSLISKYLENGKENPQFASMHKKFYKAIESEESSLSRIGSKQSFISPMNCAKDRVAIGKMFDNIIGSAKRRVDDAIDGIQDGGGDSSGAMGRIKAALMHDADEPPVYEHPDSGGWTAKILKKPGEDETSKYVSMVGMGSYPLYFTLFGLYRMHKPVVDPPSEDKIDVTCESPPPGRHNEIMVRNLNLLLSDDQPVPDMFPAQASDMLEYSKRIKDVRIPYENYNFNIAN